MQMHLIFIFYSESELFVVITQIGDNSTYTYQTFLEFLWDSQSFYPDCEFSEGIFKEMQFLLSCRINTKPLGISVQWHYYEAHLICFYQRFIQDYSF